MCAHKLPYISVCSHLSHAYKVNLLLMLALVISTCVHVCAGFHLIYHRQHVGAADIA